MSETLGEMGAPASAPAVPEPASVGEALAGGAAAGEVAAPELTPTAPPVPAAPQIDPAELQAQLEYMTSQYQQLAQYVQSQPQSQGPQEDVGQFDPSQLVDEFGQINPAALAQFLDSRNTALLSQFEERFQQVAAPLQAQQQAAEQQFYRQQIDGIVADNVAQHGELPPKALEFVESRAAEILPELKQRYGVGEQQATPPHVLKLALDRAASDVRELLGVTASSAQAGVASQLAALAGANGEPGTGATATAPGVVQFTSPRQVTEHYAAQARLAQNGS